MAPSSESPNRTRLFVIFFVCLLAALVYAFYTLVQTAADTLPQSEEIVSAEEVVSYIEAGDVERILIQEERDVFLYLDQTPRPLYSQLELGETFTSTMEALGLPPERFPPLTVEE